MCTAQQKKSIFASRGIYLDIGTLIHFYSGFREKNTRGGGGVQFEILRNPGIDFYSGFRKKSRYTLL